LIYNSKKISQRKTVRNPLRNSIFALQIQKKKAIVEARKNKKNNKRKYKNSIYVQPIQMRKVTVEKII